MVTVMKIGKMTYEVNVEGEEFTTHEVTLTPKYHKKLTGGLVTPEVLIEKSFQFMLKQTSNTKIEKSIDLAKVARKFPDFEYNVRIMLGG